MPVGGVDRTTNSNGVTVETPYEDKKTIGIDDFLQLMIAEMTNQDFDSKTDSSQYITQLAQITTMEQMKELAYYSQSNYVMSLVGKEVTAAALGYGGKVNKVTGPVEKITLSGEEFMVYVDGKAYKLNQIMTVNNPDAVDSADQQILSKLESSVVVPMKTKPDSATIRWDKPEVSVDTLSKLKYEVYYIKTDEANTFDSPELVKKGILGGTAERESYEYTLEGLEPGSRYYCNVLVTANDGRQYVYQKSSFTTPGT